MKTPHHPSVLHRHVRFKQAGLVVVACAVGDSALAADASVLGSVLPTLLYSVAAVFVMGLFALRMHKRRTAPAPVSSLSRGGDSQASRDSQASMLQGMSAVGQFSLDPEGRFCEVDFATQEILNAPSIQTGITTWARIFGNNAWLTVRKATQSGMPVAMELDLLGDVDAHKKRVIGLTIRRKGKLLEGFVQDITARTKTMEYMDHLARHDTLTHALNRVGVKRHLKKCFATLQDGDPLCVAHINIDRFKLINDLYGHEVGDQVLKETADRIRASLSRDMRLGRIGGDEFVVVFYKHALSTATQVCEGIVASLSQVPFAILGHHFPVSASLGLTNANKGTPIGEVLSQADHACRQAKFKNGAQLVVHEVGGHEQQKHKAELLLTDSLTDPDMAGNLYFEMQPIMSTSKPFASLSFEVLVHMYDTQGNTIPTEQFMTVAKTIGRMKAIDQWVLSNVLHWIRRHKERLSHVDHIFINLSGASLNDDTFVNGIVEVLGQYSDIVHWVCLEITEDVALRNLHHAKQFLTRLRTLGVKVALDDFGAGYTSFAYLRELPSDFLKIDGSLIAHINNDPANVEVVRGIVNMARSLNIQTVAEWAEDSACVQTLMDLGIHFIQGYAIARPTSPELLLQMPHSACHIPDSSLLEWIEKRSA